MLPVIYLDSVDFERRRAAPEQTASLEDLYVRTRLLEPERRRKPGESGADDGYALESQERTTTRNFSVFDSAARARNGSPGSRSIFFKSSS